MESFGVVEPEGEMSPNRSSPTAHNPGDEKPFNLKFGKDITEHTPKGLSFLARSAATEHTCGVSGQ